MAVGLAEIRAALDGSRARLGDSYKATPAGMWACSDPAEVHEVFTALDLAACRHLLDLGSGDGRVVLVASLFTRASGVEADPELTREAISLARGLGLTQAEFSCGDCRRTDLAPYDLLFIYPDKPLGWLEDLLPDGWTGRLLVYGPYFKPRALRHLKTLYAGQTICTLWGK